MSAAPGASPCPGVGCAVLVPSRGARQSRVCAFGGRGVAGGCRLRHSLGKRPALLSPGCPWLSAGGFLEKQANRKYTDVPRQERAAAGRRRAAIARPRRVTPRPLAAQREPDRAQRTCAVSPKNPGEAFPGGWGSAAGTGLCGAPRFAVGAPGGGTPSAETPKERVRVHSSALLRVEGRCSLGSTFRVASEAG